MHKTNLEKKISKAVRNIYCNLLSYVYIVLKHHTMQYSDIVNN